MPGWYWAFLVALIVLVLAPKLFVPLLFVGLIVYLVHLGLNNNRRR